jgi:hypothetical protein
MFDYSDQIDAFHTERVVLPQKLQKLLRAHRQANRDRLVSRLPNCIEGVSIGDKSFRPQGSMAMKTIVQTRFADEEYDIDDGVVIARSKLVDSNGEELSAVFVRQAICEALGDQRFNRQPELMSNCVRVYYANEDQEKHHVDIPIYRSWREGEAEVRELASESGWIESNPTQVTVWFENEVKARNTEIEQWGTQLRVLVRLVKRFCRSRSEWLDALPNGMKLTMLTVECQPSYSERIDVTIRELFERLRKRLTASRVVYNLAHPDRPVITRSTDDANLLELHRVVTDACEQLAKLDVVTDLDDAREIWDWIFQSDDFFEACDPSDPYTRVDGAGGRTFSWVQLPPWPVVPRGEVEIRAQFSRRLFGWRAFFSGEVLPKHRDLRFTCRTNVRGSYEVYWQVVNTGHEAARAGDLRGRIDGPFFGSDAYTRSESAAYFGCHWIECFVVQRGVCVARSGPFLVIVR